MYVNKFSINKKQYPTKHISTLHTYQPVTQAELEQRLQLSPCRRNVPIDINRIRFPSPKQKLTNVVQSINIKQSPNKSNLHQPTVNETNLEYQIIDQSQIIKQCDINKLSYYKNRLRLERMKNYNEKYIDLQFNFQSLPK